MSLHPGTLIDWATVIDRRVETTTKWLELSRALKEPEVAAILSGLKNSLEFSARSLLALSDQKLCRGTEAVEHTGGLNDGG